jgi:hypothetical protein
VLQRIHRSLVVRFKDSFGGISTNRLILCPIDDGRKTNVAPASDSRVKFPTHGSLHGVCTCGPRQLMLPNLLDGVKNIPCPCCIVPTLCASWNPALLHGLCCVGVGSQNGGAGKSKLRSGAIYCETPFTPYTLSCFTAVKCKTDFGLCARPLRPLACG